MWFCPNRKKDCLGQNPNVCQFFWKFPLQFSLFSSLGCMGSTIGLHSETSLYFSPYLIFLIFSPISYFSPYLIDLLETAALKSVSMQYAAAEQQRHQDDKFDSRRKQWGTKLWIHFEHQHESRWRWFHSKKKKKDNQRRMIKEKGGMTLKEGEEHEDLSQVWSWNAAKKLVHVRGWLAMQW